MNQLSRQLKTSGAIFMGLGAIVGTGIFVSIAIATGVAGNHVVLAILLAGVLAGCNGLSSAQLAAAHPVSGGTYEYGYQFLNPYLGFSAGWLFMVAKSASAATAVLGGVGYVLYGLNLTVNSGMLIVMSLAVLMVMTVLVASGIKRSNLVNTIIVTITLVGLLVLVVYSVLIQGLPVKPIIAAASQPVSLNQLCYATALMFVAYTGYGRIATLGEEVIKPQQTIPKAMILTMVITIVLYLVVTLTALQGLGVKGFANSLQTDIAPLLMVAKNLHSPWLVAVVLLAAVTAMLGVVLNLLLGLSRVLLSMARRQDMPSTLAKVNPNTHSPVYAVWATAAIIAVLVLSADVKFTWSFSAFTVLMYYAITNLAALRLPEHKRLYPKAISWLGLFGCVLLTGFIEPHIWLLGVVVLLVGLGWQRLIRAVVVNHHL